jgi:MFS family permease
MTLNFLLALAANTCFYFGFQALFPTLPLYIEHLGGTPSDNGLVTLVFAGTAVLSRPYLGGLTDRWGRKPVMLIGAVIFAVAPLGYAASHSVAGVLLARAFQGVGIAAFTTAYQALIVDLSPPEQRGHWLGLSANSMAVALVLGPLAGDALMTHLGFTPLFVASAASAALCALLVIAVRPPALQHAETALMANLRDVLAQRGLRAGLIGMSLIGLIFGAFITFIPLYAQNAELGAPGPFFTVYALALIAVQVSAGRLSDRVGRVKVAVPGLVLIGVFMLALSQARVAWVGWGAAFLYGLAAGSARVAIDGMVADSVPPHQRAMAMGLQFTSHDLWIGLGGALMGPLAQAAGYSTMYATAGLLTIAGTVAFALSSISPEKLSRLRKF